MVGVEVRATVWKGKGAWWVAGSELEMEFCACCNACHAGSRLFAASKRRSLPSVDQIDLGTLMLTSWCPFLGYESQLSHFQELCRARPRQAALPTTEAEEGDVIWREKKTIVEERLLVTEIV